MPPEVAGLVAGAVIDELAERAREPRLSGVIAAFPALPLVREALGEAAARMTLIPVETEYTEATVRALAAVPAGARLALVTSERARWDEEANDVMKIVGRHRWLKMILHDGGDRGLAARLEQVDGVLYVPRARDAVEALDARGRILVELVRQLTPRAQERLSQAAATLG
jgi:hypothetical protein